MGRRIGSKNKQTTIDPLHTAMTPKERLEFIAYLIVEHIEDDQTNGHKLLQHIGVRDEREPA